MTLLLTRGRSTGGDTLPAGYIAAEFLETHQPVAINVPVNKPLAGYSIEQSHAYSSDVTGGEAAVMSGTSLRVQIGQWNKNNLFVWIFRSQAGGSYLPDTQKTIKVDVASDGAKAYLDNTFLFEQQGEVGGTVTSFNLFSRQSTEVFAGKKYWVKMKHNGEMIRDLVPCVSTDGKPAFYDKVSKTHYAASDTSAYIAGLTLKQALKLADLPDGGGTLTVSLPSNYLENENVTNAITVANTKGWEITVASTYDEAGAISTFALRRIWVRKTKNEFGQYIDVNGTRWLVESCVAMYTHDGSEPDAHGYEPYRSLEVALEAWGLESYVDPEAEELLTELEQ